MMGSGAPTRFVPKPLGEDVAEQLEYVPASFRVIRHKRPRLACPCCDTIVQSLAPSRPIARASIPKHSWRNTKASCRRIPMRVSMRCLKREESPRRPAGRIAGASSPTCTAPVHRLSPKKPSGALANCMPSKQESAADHRMNGDRYGRNRPVPGSIVCTPGCSSCWPRFRASTRPQPPSCTCWVYGRH